MFLGDDRENAIDHVYLRENNVMLGDKYFMQTRLCDRRWNKVQRYTMYELIFKTIPNDTIYIEDDKLAYKNILLVTNAHIRNHNADNPILDNKGYKYKNIIAPLASDKIQVAMDISRVRYLNNKSDKRVGKGVIPCIMSRLCSLGRS